MFSLKKYCIFAFVVFLSLIFHIGCEIFDFENGEGKKYALIYGINDYLTIGDLQYCINDANGIYDILQEHDFEIIIRTNDEATKTNIQNDIQNLVLSMEAEDYLLFYFAGHGTFKLNIDDTYTEYFIPYEGDPASYDTFIADDEFAEWLDPAGTDKISLMFDHCYSGGHVDDNYESYFSLNRQRFTVITASKANETSLEYGAPINHGIFTYYLIEGLTDNNADINSDKTIALSELYYYCSVKVTGSTSNQQHPQFLGNTGVELIIF